MTTTVDPTADLDPAAAPDALPSPEPADELDTFDPIPETLKLSNGAHVRLLDLRTRQFFRLMRIITRGAGGFLMQANLSINDSVENFVAKLLGVVIVALPEAEDETLIFLASMVEPEGLIDRPKLSPEEQERNAALWGQVDAALANPELEDSVDLIEAIIRREAADIQALGKRLQRMFSLAQAAGRTPQSEASAVESAPSATSNGSTRKGSSAGSRTRST